MLGFLNDIHPLILDVAVISILVLITSLGAIRGIKNVSINVLLLSASLFLGFCPYTTSLKQVVAEALFKLENLAPAGSSEIFKFAISLVVPLLSSLVIFLLFYVVLFVVRILIELLVKKAKNGTLKHKSKVGRVFAGLISLVYGGVLMLFILTIANTNMVGMKNPIEKSTVVKFGVEKSEKLLVKIDEQFKEKLFVKILAGDVLLEVKAGHIRSFNHFEDKVKTMVDNKDYFENIATALTKEEGQALAKERIDDLYHLSVLTNCLKNDSNSIASSYISLANSGLTTINRLVKSGELGLLEYSINDFTSIRKSIKNAGVSEDVLKYLDEIVLQN